MALFKRREILEQLSPTLVTDVLAGAGYPPSAHNVEMVIRTAASISAQRMVGLVGQKVSPTAARALTHTLFERGAVTDLAGLQSLVDYVGDRYPRVVADLNELQRTLPAILGTSDGWTKLER